MTIALIAHDSKKELMVQFCTAYCRILSQHKLVATGTTGKLIAEATGLQVQRFLAGVQGGDQQIASRIACNEIDLLLFFRDPINAKPSEPNEMTLLRLCDVHNIPMATNIATAEVLIHGLERGDLDWRDGYIWESIEILTNVSHLTLEKTSQKLKVFCIKYFKINKKRIDRMD